MCNLRKFKVVLVLLVPLLLTFQQCGPSAPPGAGKAAAGDPADFLPTPHPDRMDTAYFLARMADYASPAQLHPQEKTWLVSSHTDQTEVEDRNVFLGEYKLDGKLWRSLLDQAGPGCLTRLWFPGEATGALRIYFDYEAEPTIDTTIEEFFSGNYRYFKPFLVNPPSISGGGYVCYFPFPFARNCSIMTDASTPEFQYQVNVLQLPEGKEVITYRPELDDAAQAWLRRLSRQVQPESVAELITRPKMNTESIALKPKTPVTALELAGPGALDYLQIHLDPFTEEALSRVRLRVLWDGLRDPAVDCTLREFFCHVQTNSSWSNRFMGVLSDRKLLFSRFYMPFRKRAQLIFENGGDQEVSLRLSYEYRQQPIAPETLYFFAHNYQRRMITGLIYPFLDMEAKGNLIGMSLLVSAPAMEPKYFYLEGDEYFYVDGEERPSWSGTGTVNYFNGANRFDPAPFLNPLYGCLLKQDEEGGTIGSFRFHLLDAIPFEHSLLYLQEIGSPPQFVRMDMPLVFSRYSCTLYWYAQPAGEKIPRRENVYHFILSATEAGQPSGEDPVFINQNLQIKLPQGTYWIHYAPRWDLSQVQHTQQVVETGG